MSIHHDALRTTRQLRPVLVAMLMMVATGEACAGLPDGSGPVTSMPTSGVANDPDNVPESPVMPASPEASTGVTAELATLEAQFDYSSSDRSLQVRYRIDNGGEAAVAVFDRGDRHAVLTRQHAAGEVPSPYFSVDDAGALTLSHEALPLSHPAPTSPPTPLAARLVPGASLDAGFSFTLPTSIEAARLRWCVGVAPFNEDDFTAGESTAGVDLWRASFSVVDAQQLLCTPWFDLDRGAFVDGDS